MTKVGTAMSAGYRADGLRAWEDNGTTRTYYLYDGYDIVCELNSSGNVMATNTFEANGLVSRGGSGFYTVEQAKAALEKLEVFATSSGQPIFRRNLHRDWKLWKGENGLPKQLRPPTYEAVMSTYIIESEATVKEVQRLARHTSSLTTMKAMQGSEMTAFEAIKNFEGLVTRDPLRSTNLKRMVGGTGLEPVTPTVSL